MSRGETHPAARTAAPAGDVLPAINPADGTEIATLPLAAPEELDRAVQAAADAQAQPGWAAPSARAAALSAIAAGIEAEADRLATLECLDTGKPISQARADVEAAVRYFRYYAGAADKIHGTSIPLGPGYVDYTVREPWGVCGQIIPWNYPLQVAARCVAPALAAGNAVVLKPSEEASLTPVELGRIAAEAGLPDGLLHVLVGRGDIGAALVAHGGVSHVTFVGSPRTGTAVLHAAAERLVPVELELGGKSPNVVFADADLDRAAEGAVRSLIQNAGQSCSAGSRLLVERGAEEQLLERVVERFRSLELGPGIEDAALGPLVSQRQLDHAEGMIRRAVEQGSGTLTTGGKRPDGHAFAQGFYLEPTLFTDVAVASELWNEEVFGPVLAVRTFEGEDEAVRLANSTVYGLVAAVWTSDVGRALRVAGRIAAGQVYVNGYGVGGGVEIPFGGYKRSGFGRGKGMEALIAYTQIKNVCVTL